MTNDDMDLDCGRVRGELAAYLYDELASETRAALERHLEACAPCTDELTTLHETRALLAKWETPASNEDPRELAHSIARAANGARGTPAARPWRPRLVRWSAAVSGAAAALLFTFSLLNAQVRMGDGRFELSFGRATPSSARDDGLDPALRQELQTIAAQEVALRAADLEQSQEALVARLSQMTQEEILRLSRAVDLALDQTQRDWNTRLTSLGQDAARADLETRRAMTELASYLPVNQSNR
jgi:anti-sigma factor RsiW